ncbi:MAG: HAD-IC family P-type ATPase, partial [Candidatus Paceibacteria bacterium]
HSLTIQEVFKNLDSSANGLSLSEVKVRQSIYGKNIFPEPGKRSPAFFLLRQFKNPLIFILIAAGFISWLFGKKTDSLVIFAAVFLNVFIGFFQEFQADKTFQKLKRQIKINSVVVRDGKQRVVDASELVPGDVIVLHSGDKVPADARIIFATGASANESILTGEWLASEKDAGVLPQETLLAERKNMLFMGTALESGRVIAIVTKTGSETEFGKIAKLSGEARRISTPLQENIKHLTQFIGRAAVIIIILLFALGMLKGIQPIEMFLVSVAVSVAAIPEGLPAAVSVVLAIGMQRILRQKGLVRQILATETLGRASVILTDKTGTLTYGSPNVEKLYIVKGSQENLLQIAYNLEINSNHTFASA